MALAAKKPVEKPGARKPRKSVKKTPNRLTLDRNQDTTNILHGPMQDAIREAFLKRPNHL
jgi:hypothetical protein